MCYWRGAGFSAFTFHTHFELRFRCDRNKNIAGKSLPFEIVLCILSDWWFGSQKEWDKKVEELTAEENYIEPDEPVLAMKLVALRWREGSFITEVYFTPEKLELKFVCGECITISNHDEMDAAWEIVEYHAKDRNNSWSVSCYNGEIDYNIPE